VRQEEVKETEANRQKQAGSEGHSGTGEKAVGQNEAYRL